MKPDNKDFINSVNLNIHTDFPYLILNVKNDVAVPRNPGFHVMPWIISVRKGIIPMSSKRKHTCLSRMTRIITRQCHNA